jgi:hypothetical protein
MIGFRGTRNTDGRPKGSQNKDTTVIRNCFQLLVENNLEQLDVDLKKLEPKDRIKAVLDLAKFVIPLLKATELTTSTLETAFNPILLTITTKEDIELMAKKFNEQY